jgi:hypothetical protein
MARMKEIMAGSLPPAARRAPDGGRRQGGATRSG